MQNGLLIGAVGIFCGCAAVQTAWPLLRARGHWQGWWCAAITGRRSSWIWRGEFQWAARSRGRPGTRPLEHVSFAGEFDPLRHARPVGLDGRNRRGIDGRIPLGVDHGVAGAEPGYGGPILDDLQAPAAGAGADVRPSLTIFRTGRWRSRRGARRRPGRR